MRKIFYFLDSLSNSSIKLILTRHEQATGFMAATYGHLTGKPGKGGILPAIKVTAEVASIRNIPIGQSSISPNRHLDIKTPTDLLEMIERIRDITGKPVGFKTVISSHIYIEQLCAAILKRGITSAPDFITLDGGEGGTAAAPLALADLLVYL